MNRKRSALPNCLGEETAGGFSLVELLVVMAVIAILMALAGLAISSLGASRRLTTAGNMTVDMINHARQAARSQNTLAMLAMVQDGGGAERVLGTFLFTATNGTNGSWKPIERWRELPDGVQVDKLASARFFTAPPSSAPAFERAGVQVDCLAAIFLPDGRLWSASSQSPVVYLGTPNGATNNFYKIIINPATGVPMIRRP